MSYRDDHAAAVMRAEAGDRETARLTEENARLVRELATAKMWLGGPQRRLVFGGVAAAIGLALVAGGVVLGRITADAPDPVVRAPRASTLPAIAGVMVADGPKLGHWTLNATRCVVRDDGIELTASGSEDYAIWLTNNQVEVELPTGVVPIEHVQCGRGFIHRVIRHDSRPPTFDGYVELDCGFQDNRLQGRIDFRNCQ